ncbi:MAG: hypothetical protein EP329_26780 [Deltaproteobacteria bacterium]|nr:MAG: hypothetical protein EP329_26780 [Deltaproteobacteria bacterium]
MRMGKGAVLGLALVALAAGCGKDEVGNVEDVLGDASGVPCDGVQDCIGVFELHQCEVAVCSDAGVCAIGFAPPGTPCRDGFACTGPDFCNEGICGGGQVNCNDNDPCTDDSCDNKVGCVFVPASGSVCDDGNPCTQNDTCVDGTCGDGEPIAGCCRFDGECNDADPCTDDRCVGNTCEARFNYAPCDDGNDCTEKDHCDGEGGCAGDVIACEDGNPCTLDVCNPETGRCESGPASDGTGCEDGNPCTILDACVAGVCQGGTSQCQCTTDADCASFEDDSLCNGVLHCVGLQCVIDPLTVVSCNPTGDTPCAKNTCDPDTGQCAPRALEEGASCDDQNPCTTSDECHNGLCSGVSRVCDDGNACTFDSCSPVTGCVYTPSTQPCDDGNGCTVNDHCGGGVCSGTQKVCDDDNPCTSDSCQGGQCVYTPNTLPCDDGNPCTEDDVCDAGSCSPGVNSCECTLDADCASQEDGNACNGKLHCVNHACVINPTTVVTCDTSGDTDCLVTRCAPGTGVCGQEPRANGTVCSDGSACTANDACSGGACVGTAVDCEDGNPCTTNSCNPASGCVSVNNNVSCDDGDRCTGNDKCQGGACHGVAIACDDGNPCTIDSCDPTVGCKVTNAQNGLTCNDGNACTGSDKCQAGGCVGTAISCDDGNPCTADHCLTASGCAHDPLANATPCSDGSLCTGGDKCQAGFCVGTTVSCDDGDPCTVESCDPATGCGYADAANGTSCSDGDPCTSPDTCQGGECSGGAFVCGCQSNADCASSEDGDACNGTLFCDTDGNCKVDPATIVTCTTADPCLIGTCNPSDGSCSTAPRANGTSCDDGDGCTENDTCFAGVCGGVPSTCDDGNPCTLDACEGNQCVTRPAFDGQLCADDGNTCTQDMCLDGVCAHPAVANGVACEEDGNTCRADVCDGGTCTHPPLPDTYPCADDGNPCTYDRCDGAGACLHVSNDPAPVSANQCFPVTELTADTGPVTGTWDDCGVADQFDFGAGQTGAINNWPCADPSFLYDGPDTGYEYAYIFVAPTTGVCTFIEYEEGVKVPPNQLFGVIDWFILDGSGQCDASACLEYVWENVKGEAICGGGQKTCSYRDFAVTEGQIFYIVADVYDGLVSGGHQGYDFNADWNIEIKCDDTSALLLDEDFSDAACDGCSTSVQAAPDCTNFDWHVIGGFGPVTTGYYLGQLENSTLSGYDCGATTATVTFPTVTLPATATSCTLTFDLYTDIDPVDDGSCVNDVLTVMGDTGAGPAFALPGDACGGTLAFDENPFGRSSAGIALPMSYDLTAYAGQTFTLSLDWSANATNNTGLGVIIDHVRIACETP